MVTLLIIFGLFALVSWGIFHKPAHNKDWDTAAESVATVLGSVLLAILLVILSVTRAGNTIGNTELELAYSTTIQNYETTVTKTKALLSTELSNAKFVDGSIERMQIATAVSERLVEMRNQVNRLNEIIVSKNAWAHEYLLGGFLWTPPAPKHLKPYILQ